MAPTPGLVTYSMNISLDGYIVGPDGGLLAEGDDAPRIILGDVTRDDIDAARREVDYLGRRRPTTYAAWERDG